MKMIISKPRIEHVDGRARLVSKIIFDEWAEKEREIWYSVEEEYADYLCTERGDAFLVGLLPYVMSHSNYDDPIKVISEVPISEKLLYQIKIHFMPTMVKCVEWYHPIVIQAEEDHEKLPSQNAVGTGISGGVDSYYSLLRSLALDPKDYKVTHGLYCETEAYGDFDGELQTAYREMASKICAESGIGFVDVRSNICLDIYEMIHEACDAFIFVSFSLALQKLFDVYYFSSSHTYENTRICNSSEYAALFHMYCLETENIDLYVTGSDATRQEKTGWIADYDLPQKYFMVCREPTVVNGMLHNCSLCSKCTRTMIDLDITGKLDNFKNIFDVDYYNAHKDYYWGYLYFKGKKGGFTKEIFDSIKEKKIHMPLRYRIAGVKKIVQHGFKRGNPLEETYRP